MSFSGRRSAASGVAVSAANTHGMRPQKTARAIFVSMVSSVMDLG